MPEREKPLIGWQRQRSATDDHEDDEMMKWFQPQKLGSKRPRHHMTPPNQRRTDKTP